MVLALKGGDGSRGGWDFEGAALINIRYLGLTGRHCVPHPLFRNLHDQNLSGEVSVVFSSCLMENRQKDLFLVAVCC